MAFALLSSRVTRKGQCGCAQSRAEQSSEEKRGEKSYATMAVENGRGGSFFAAVEREPPLHVLARRHLKCTTLCPVLDDWLRGGIPCGHLTEFAGEAGAAKTQLCLQLLLAVQLPHAVGGLDGAAVYIHTEGRAPLTRLKQLIASNPNVAPHLPPGHDPLDHIYLAWGSVTRRGAGRGGKLGVLVGAGHPLCLLVHPGRHLHVRKNCAAWDAAVLPDVLSTPRRGRQFQINPSPLRALPPTQPRGNTFTARSARVG